MWIRPWMVSIIVGCGFVPQLALADDAQTPDSTMRVVVPSTIVNEEAITRFSPGARADVVSEIVRSWSKADGAGINNIARIQQFFAEIATETGGMTMLAENLNYSAKRLMRVWPKRFDAAKAQQYAGDEVGLANYVYDGRNGNRPGTDDGWTYRGSGLIQLTGRGNFRDRGKELGLGTALEDDPDQVRQPVMAFQTAYAYWAISGAGTLADKGDTAGVRKAVNGGLLGLNDTLIWLARAHRAFRLPEIAENAGSGATSDEDAAVLGQLQSLGYVQPSVTAGASAKPQIEEGLKAFQKDNGLKQTGTLDDSTLYKLTDPQLVPKE